MFHVGVHPALTGGPVPEVLDSSWLTSGEGLRDSHPLLYARVQGLWDQGRPPNVTVVSDHGTWGDDAVSLGEGLAAQVEGFGTEAGPSFRGLPGFTYASSTLDQVVFTRRGVLPEQDRFLVFTLNSPDKFLTVHRILHAPPMNVLGGLRLRFTAEVAKSLYTASDDFPAFLLTVAGPGLAPHMLPPGFVLGLWEVRGNLTGEPDFYSVDSPRLRALRSSLVGTVVDVPSTTHTRWA